MSGVNKTRFWFWRRDLFSWNDVPGNDNERLIKFLKKKFGIDWVKKENIKKSDDHKTISASAEKNLSLILNDDKTHVNLKIDDGRTYEFSTRSENSKLKIYDKTWFEGDIQIIVEAIFYLIFLFVIAIIFSSGVHHPLTTIIQGISIFAIFYLIAQLSERVTELFSNISLAGNAANQTRIDILKNAISKIIENNKADLSIEFIDKPPIKEMIDEVNSLNKKNDHESTERVIRLWFLASFIGVVFTSYAVGLFEIIGLNLPHFEIIGLKLLPHTLDSFFSGIIIGGGTKPLHDLMSYIEKKA